MTSDPVSRLVYDVDPRVGFWVADRVSSCRRLLQPWRREWSKVLAQLRQLRLENPGLFDQVVVLLLAAGLELLVSYLKRR